MAALWKNRQTNPSYSPANGVYMTDTYAESTQYGDTSQYNTEMPKVPVTDASVETRALKMVGTTASSLSSVPAERAHSHGWKKTIYVAKWLAVTVIVGGIISIPMVLTRQTLFPDTSGTIEDIAQRLFQSQYQNLVFWLFGWLLMTWVSACLFHLIAQVFPYCFRAVAKYVNPAHRRYWQVFRAMKWPITLLGTAIGSYVAYAVLIFYNEAFIANIPFDDFNGIDLSNVSAAGVGSSTKGQNNTLQFDDSAKATVQTIEFVLANVLFNVILWTSLYFVEKCIIVYISVHFHYRSNFRKLKNTKRIIIALATLFDASVYLQPLYNKTLRVEDYLIHQPKDQSKNKVSPTAYVSRFFGTGGKKLTSALGHLASSEESSHWFQPDSTYAVVSRALDHPAAAAALAKRIWVSLVHNDRDALRLDDIAAVLGPNRHQEAQEIFTLLDENENGDIRLNELIPTIVGAGNLRRDIYAGMHDIDHTLNTLDWIFCLILAAAMIFFILVSWVPQIADLRSNLSFIVVGAAFVVGRIGHELFSGAIFVLFKHVFDIADHVKLYNAAETQAVACIVKRISLLYVVFERIEDGMTMQISNEKLNTKRIENVSRSGINRESIDLHIDFGTSFKDIGLLRNELSQFINRKENSRDFHPRVDVRVKSIADMSKLQLSCSFWHKSNWSNDELRAARSSRFLCALVAAIRKVPISKPGGSGARTGDEGKPAYTVTITEEEAAKKRQEEGEKQAAKRMDHVVHKPEAVSTAIPSTFLNLEELPVLQEDQIPSTEHRKQNSQEKESAAAAAAVAAAAEQAKLEEERRIEHEAYEKISEVPLETEADVSGANVSSALLKRVNSEAFSFISGRERGSRRPGAQPGQSTPFYTPWD